MNTQPDELLVKQKRDEYLVEIRKTKNMGIITAKRAKLSLDPMDSQNGMNPENKIPLPSINELAATFLESYKARNLPGILNALTSIRIKISKDDNPPISELIQTYVVPFILDLIKPELANEENVITEALWILINIASKDSIHVEYLVSNDIIPRVLKLFDHPNFQIKENIIWILANICGENLFYREEILSKGIAKKIEKLIDGFEGPESVIISVAWFISNLCRGEPYPKFKDIKVFLPHIKYLMENSDNQEALGHCMWAILYITNSDEDNPNIIQEVLSMNILKGIIDLLNYKNTKIIPPIIRTVGNIVNGTDQEAQEMINAGAIQALFPFLTHELKLIRKEACWAYSNILAGVPSQAKAVFEFEDGKIIDILFELLRKDQKEVQDECIYALANACETGDIASIGTLVDHGILDSFLDVINSNPKYEILKICLQAIDEVLTHGQTISALNMPENNPYLVKLLSCGGMDVLEGLYNKYSNHEIMNLTQGVLMKLNVLI